MKARIYQPSKTAMQSGRAKAKGWMLEYELETARRPEPLMGWAASGDTNNQVRINFSSRKEAEDFAKKEGLMYDVEQPRSRRVRPRSYLDNFKYQPPDIE